MASSLKSTSTAKILDLISEGEIEGLVNGDKSIFFNKTPVQEQGGEYNWRGVGFDERTGTPGQEYVPNFDAAETQVAWTPQEVTSSVSPVVTTSAGTDTLRITIQTPGLYRQRSSGDIDAASIELVLERKTSAGSVWETVKTKEIRGKAMSPYQESYRVPRPEGTNEGWQVRLRRTDGGPSTSDKRKNQLYLQAVTEIQDIQLTYPNSAYIASVFDAESTNGVIPKRGFEVRGIKVQVPTNWVSSILDTDGSVIIWGFYNNPAGGFAGFKPVREWTNDPAWILYDLLTNDRYGLGTFVDEVDIDVHSFYDASVFNMHKVDDGIGTGPGQVNPGGQEHRFAFNGVIQKSEDSIKVLQAVAATCRSQLEAGAGQIRLLQDRPTLSTMLIGNSDVIDGKFTYSLGDRKAVKTSMNITFNDGLDSFLPKTVTMDNYAWDAASNLWIADGPGQNATARFGINKQSLALPSVSSEGQAMREANWALDTHLNGSNTIQFSVGWRKALMQAGDVIDISDELFTGNQMSGLVAAGDNLSAVITLDQAITDNGGTYRLLIGTEERNVLSMVGAEVTVSWAFNDFANLKGQSYILEGATDDSGGLSVVPQQYKVISIAENGVGQYKVSAAKYDVTKYSRVEDGIVVPAPLYGAIGGESIAAPIVDTIFNESYVDDINDVTRQKVTITWFEVVDDHLLGYQVLYRSQNGQWITSDMISGTSYTVQDLDVLDLDPTVPDLEFYLSAFTTNGVESPRTYGTYDFNFGSSDLNAVQGLVLEDIGGTAWLGQNFVAVWTDPNPPADETPPGADRLKDYVVELYREGDTPGSTPPTKVYYTTAKRFEYTKAMNDVDFFGATRKIKMVVYARDTLLDMSAGTVTLFTNEAPALAVNPQLIAFTSAYRLTHNSYAAISDSVGILIWHEEGVSDFTPDVTNLHKDSQGTFHDVEATPDTTYYVKWAIYDTFGREELNIATGQTITTFASSIVDPPPDATGTVTVTSNLVPPDNDVSELHLSWDEVTGASDYLIEIIQYAQDGITVVNKFTPIIANVSGVTQTYDFEGKVNTKYDIRVRARNGQGAIGVYSPTTAHTTVGDTQPPAIPTNLVTTNGLGAVALQWTNPPDLDYIGTSVYMTTSNIATPLPTDKIITVNGENYFISALTPSIPYYFWVTASDLSGNESGFSVRAVGTPQTSGLVLGPDTVTTVELAQAAVLEENLSNGAVTETKIKEDSIITGHIKANAITSGKIVAGSINGSVGNIVHINAKSINSADIAAGGIIANNIQSGTITANEIDAGTITGDRMNLNTLQVGLSTATGTVTIKNGYINANMIQANSITAANIDTSSLRVGSGTNEIVINNGYITAPKISAGAITATTVGANQIITNVANIQSGIIQTAHIQNAQITSAKIKDATIQNGDIANATIQNAKIQNAAVSTLKIAGNAVTIPQGIYFDKDVVPVHSVWTILTWITMSEAYNDRPTAVQVNGIANVLNQGNSNRVSHHLKITKNNSSNPSATASAANTGGSIGITSVGSGSVALSTSHQFDNITANTITYTLVGRTDGNNFKWGHVGLNLVGAKR